MSDEVPAYRTMACGEASLSAARARYCVFVFVLDEGERIRRQLIRMKPYSGMADIFVADGGSTDGSLDPEYLAAQGIRGLLVKEGPGKLGAQMRMAFDFARRRGYEGIICMDGNDKDDPSAIPSFIAKLREGFDHIQGSRYVPGGMAINTPALRHFGVRLVHAPLISLASGRRCTDTTNGFRAYSAKFLADPRVDPLRDLFRTYELHYYLAIRAARLGYRVCEIPVTRAYPARGKVPTKIRGFAGNLAIMKILLKACSGAYDPA